MPSSNDPSARRLHLWSGLIFLALFLSGAATGIGVVTWLRPHGGPPFMGHGPWRPGGHLPPWMRDLELTPEQEPKVRELMEKARSQVDSLLRETFPKVRAVHEQTDKELKLLLTPEQWKKWQSHPRPGGPGPMGVGHHGPPGPGFGFPGGAPPPGGPGGFDGPPPPMDGTPGPPPDAERPPDAPRP